MKKLLSQLLPAFENTLLAADGTKITDLKEINEIPIENLVFDSREVTKNTLFFALPGTHIDGNNFIAQAIEKGANAVVFQGSLTPIQKEDVSKAIVQRTLDNAISDDQPKFAPVLINVPDARFSMAPVSATFYDNPSERLVVIGVTGTEGKSSTVSFIWQLLRALGHKAGFISTVEYSFGGDAVPNPQHQTTPEATIIQHHLNQMLENGCRFAVVETSSHGLSPKLNRTGNILFDCGIFMNVTLEHLEFHKTFEQYRDDKANLFRKLGDTVHVKNIGGEKTKITPVGIVNLEDPSAEYFVKATNQKVFGYTTLGKAGRNAEEGKKAELPEIPAGLEYMTADNILSDAQGLNFSVKAPDGTSFDVNSKLPGAFNAYNLMASIIAVSSMTGLSFKEVAAKIPELTPIKGRMTVINQGQPFELIIDYAHTPSSFETIFPPIRKRCKGKMICVFGSGGERDLTKRPLQGAIAAKFCDTVILADEDPRGEDPVELLKMIAVGAEKEGKVMGENLFITHERPKAIRQAFSMAGKNDIVLLLGKSHENSIIYKDGAMPYDEITEAKNALSEMNYKN
ncbi:UDP-N-acetylmuramoyl-L-alanyl-D-glutamate--2,6-diaminopimelate ligase [Treponema sp. C6A8]|uniref:UDP-N-acetylmuramoyl-L-alanyl-D-glutamate--2, 6-diaminopimelate ligase n=1 Tax=Treponema sp. C6A8 TaxID=1410609 RepID=UPI000570FC82|nr:UDP-N-acetylmuramoyl-L-alanyl-D-glutamate--2,6-diaminopimelate ligase [Treponema sp. C6A8]